MTRPPSAGWRARGAWRWCAAAIRAAFPPGRPLRCAANPGAAAPRPAPTRRRSSSRAGGVLYGFADRIGQRLRQTAEQQTAAAAAGDDRLLPVLSARDERIDAAVAQAFPHVQQRTGSVGGYTAGCMHENDGHASQ